MLCQCDRTDDNCSDSKHHAIESIQIHLHKMRHCLNCLVIDYYYCVHWLLNNIVNVACVWVVYSQLKSVYCNLSHPKSKPDHEVITSTIQFKSIEYAIGAARTRSIYVGIHNYFVSLEKNHFRCVVVVVAIETSIFVSNIGYFFNDF